MEGGTGSPNAFWFLSLPILPLPFYFLFLYYFILLTLDSCHFVFHVGCVFGRERQAGSANDAVAPETALSGGETRMGPRRKIVYRRKKKPVQFQSIASSDERLIIIAITIITHHRSHPKDKDTRR